MSLTISSNTSLNVGAGFGRAPARLDPERYRRRLMVLAELAEVHSVRDRVAPRRARVDRLREVIAQRKRIG